MYRGRLEAVQAASRHQRTRRSAGSPDRLAMDPCLACGHSGGSGDAEQLEQEVAQIDAAAVLAHSADAECPASPTDPPPHAGFSTTPPPEESADLAGLSLEERGGGGSSPIGGRLEHIRQFGHDQQQHDDIFEMHKPLWM